MKGIPKEWLERAKKEFPEFESLIAEMKEETSLTGGHPRFHELVQTMREIHDRKNADYGGGNPLGNFFEGEQFGGDPFEGVLWRMSDKWSRICSLKRTGQQYVKDESIIDTLLDLANYSVIAVVIYEELSRRDRKNALCNEGKEAQADQDSDVDG